MNTLLADVPFFYLALFGFLAGIALGSGLMLLTTRIERRAMRAASSTPGFLRALEIESYDEEDFPYDCTWDGTPGHSCGAVGSEDCDWECPLSREMWAGLRGETADDPR